jgi:hypothetical protein
MTLFFNKDNQGGQKFLSDQKMVGYTWPLVQLRQTIIYNNIKKYNNGNNEQNYTLGILAIQMKCM